MAVLNRVGAGAVLALVAVAASPAVAGQGAQPSHAAIVLPHSAPNPPANPPPKPDPLTQPHLDGCQRDPVALLTRQSPEWVYIYNTGAASPVPAPRWVVGTVSSGNTLFQAVHVAGGDLPQGHNSYDFNVNILPDAGFDYLVAGDPNAHPPTGAYAGSGEDYARLHTEWEDLAVAKFAWPEPGDHIAELGAWVWDCGHWGVPSTYDSPDYVLPKLGQPCVGIPDPAQCQINGEGSEFHPYRALWVQRAQPSNSPTGESEAELFISSEKTIAGQEADCAHKNPPPSVNAAYPPSYIACLQTEPNWQDVSGDYSFLLPAPAKPSPSAVLTFRQVDAGSLVGAPSPTLQAEGNALRVTFHVASVANQPLKMAYRFFAGWNQPPAAGIPTHLHITYDKLEIHRAMDPGCTTNAFGAPLPCVDAIKVESTRANQATTAPGDWNLFLDASGNWGQWAPGDGEFLPNEGDILAGTATTDIYVPQGSGWRMFVHGRECDLGNLGASADCPSNHETADDNDVPGLLIDTYPTAMSSLGTHRSNGLTRKDDPTSTCPNVINGTTPVNPEGCYSLTYTVTAPDLQTVVPEAPWGVALFVVGAAAATLVIRARLRPAALRSGERDQGDRRQD